MSEYRREKLDVNHLCHADSCENTNPQSMDYRDGLRQRTTPKCLEKSSLKSEYYWKECYVYTYIMQVPSLFFSVNAINFSKTLHISFWRNLWSITNYRGTMEPILNRMKDD